MLLGRQWLKQTKIHHGEGNNTLTIIFKNKVVTFSTIKIIELTPSQ
jgi:hypothetical protein